MARNGKQAVYFTLYIDQLEELKSLAESQDRSVSNYVNRLIVAHLGSGKK